MPALSPFRLQPTFSARTWGRPELQPWYPKSVLPETAEPIGEAWLTGPDSTVAEGPHAGETLAALAKSDSVALLGSAAAEAEFPLLIKLLFPNDKLSVQVHPNDAEAQVLGEGRGKTECWYVLEAEPGATVACGLLPGITVDHLKASIADGSMERLLNHVPVRAGDLVFVDAGTVHAIGPGVTILEVQQTSDITYRLFDYGRPRELHLERGLAVSKAETRAGKVTPEAIPHGKRLIREQYFTVESYRMQAGETITLEDAGGKPQCFVALHGDAEVTVGADTIKLAASSAVIVPATAGTVSICGSGNVEVVRATP